MFRLILCIGLLLNFNSLLCQQREFVNCRLIDKKNEKPIPFASVRVKKKALGLISNSDGGFKIPINFKNVGDTLEIASLGYKSKEILLSKLLKGRLNTIYLSEAVQALKEVVVTTPKKTKRLTANEIVQFAIHRITENFPVEPFSYVGYYRDYQTKQGDYLNLNEAVLAVFDSGFEIEDFKSTKIRLYKYEENQDFKRDSIASKTYDYVNRSKVIPKATIAGRIENEYTRLRLHDAIRNHNIYTYSFIDRLDLDLIKNHKLSLKDDTYFDGIPLYSIEISKVLDNFVVVGNVYIDKTNFSIHKLKYAVFEKGPIKYRAEPFSNTGIRSFEKGKPGKLIYNINVEYQRYADKMYLNYISFSNSFQILLPPKFKPVAAEINSERRRFELILNNPPLEKDGLKRKNYKLYYQENKLAIEKIEIKKNKVFLYPKNANLVFDSKRVQYFKARTDKGVAIEIMNVQDIYGNMINESEAIVYKQFREFFTQQLSLNMKSPLDSLYMVKTSPINGNQPIVPPANLSDYWMNTPLKK